MIPQINQKESAMHWTVCPSSYTEELPSMETSAMHHRFLRNNVLGGMQLMWRLSRSEDVLSNVECWKGEVAL